MLILELANAPYKLIPYDEGDSYVTYKFVTKAGMEYFINLNIFDEELDVEFQAEGAPSGKNQSVLNTGDAFRVFATVVQSIRHFMGSNQVNVISFMCKKSEPSRVKLYDQMAKVLPKYLPNFRFVEKNDDQVPTYFSYKFVRKGTE